MLHQQFPRMGHCPNCCSSQKMAEALAEGTSHDPKKYLPMPAIRRLFISSFQTSLPIRRPLHPSVCVSVQTRALHDVAPLTCSSTCTSPATALSNVLGMKRHRSCLFALQKIQLAAELQRRLGLAPRALYEKLAICPKHIIPYFLMICKAELGSQNVVGTSNFLHRCSQYDERGPFVQGSVIRTFNQSIFIDFQRILLAMNVVCLATDNCYLRRSRRRCQVDLSLPCPTWRVKRSRALFGLQKGYRMSYQDIGSANKDIHRI